MRTNKKALSLLITVLMISVMVLGAGTPAAAAEDISTHFTDPNFKHAVWEWIGGSGPPGSSGTFTKQNLIDNMAANTYNLDVHGLGITSLAGLEDFAGTGLLGLFCNDNKLTVLPDLPDSLKGLNCNNNQLTSLPDLPGSLILPGSLTTLSCGNNQLTSLPTLPGSLTDLYCGNNRLTNLPAPLPVKLEYLQCDNNQLTNLPTLPVKLEYLWCYNNQLTSLPTLPGSLRNLDCNDNRLTSLPALPGSLRNLVCNDNQLTNLPALPGSLTDLRCNNNQLTSLPGLPGGLVGLWCINNQLTSLPTLPDSLMYLHCHENQLTGLPALPGSLAELWCYGNYLNLFSGSLKTAIDACTANNKSLTPQYRFTCSGTGVSLNAGGTYQITVSDLRQEKSIDGTAWSGIGSPADLSDFTFTSSDTNVCTVDSSGLITAAHAAGSCSIYALYKGIDAEYTKVAIPVTVAVVPPATYICQIGAQKYTSLDAAIGDVPGGNDSPVTISLLQEITQTSPVVIDRKNIVFELNGFDLTIDTRGIGRSTALKVTDVGSVSCTGNGKLNAYGSRYGVYAYNYSQIYMTGDIIATGDHTGDMPYPGTGAYASGGGTTVTVDGSVTGDPYAEVSGRGYGPNEYLANSSKPGYREYGYGGINQNAVFVKEGSASVWPAGSTMVASDTTDTSTVLTWTDANATVDYAIYRENSLIGTTLKNTLTYTATGLSPDTEYTFQVQATYYDEVSNTNKWTTDGPSVKVRTSLPKEPTPSATFAAKEVDSGTLANMLPPDMRYSVDGGSTWLPSRANSMVIYGVTAANGIQVKKLGNGTTTSDSDIQIITITKAATPTGLSKADCTTDDQNDGKLLGLTDAMEYKLFNEFTWTSGTGGDITGLANGGYYVRVKATGTVLASGNAELVIAPYGLTLIPVPAANSDLKWTGSEQIGVEGGTGYILGETYKATDVSVFGYNATATLQAGYAWDDGTTVVKNILWNIGKADGPAAPIGLAGVAPTTVGGSDGKITGTTIAMEYANNIGFYNVSDCFVDETTGLEAGTYYVRVKATVNHEAGVYAIITIQPAPTTHKPSTPTYKADVKTGNNAGTTIPVVVDKNAGTALIDAGSLDLAQGETVITVPSIPNADTYLVGIPVPDLSTAKLQGTLTIDTDMGSVTVPSNMLTGVAGIKGDKAVISIGEGDKAVLRPDVKTAVGNRSLVQLTLSIDGKQTDWNNPKAPVSVSIPYKPTATELANSESIIIWCINDSGNTVFVPNGHYNPISGTVDFIATHFGKYAVGYNKVNFNDVVSNAWYSKAINFIAARGITSGTGNGNYSPDAKLTRGEFIVLMMKAYGIAPDVNPADNFADAGNTYYTGYLEAAKRLGIAAGIGNNLYAPSREITRQEMFTLLYNALKTIGQLPQGNDRKILSDFNDADQVASWAKDAMTLLVKTGIINGNTGKLNPTGTTTRAEMAQVLYNLLRKVMQ